MSQSLPDIEEMKKCLKDANLLDEVMDSEDMMAFYSAIKSSKDTADKETQRQSVSHSKIESEEEDIIDGSDSESSPKLPAFKARQWSTQKRQPDLSVATVIPKRAKSAKEDLQERLSNIDIFETPPSKKPPLDIIYHDPKFIGPYYCLDKVRNMPLNERMKCISSYHHALNAELESAAQISLYFAPWPAPIRPNFRYNDSVSKETPKTSSQIDESSFEASICTDETYTSRVGRQTKRKIYTESLMEEVETKKPKPVKRPGLKKGLSTAEIMNRSSLFADSPKSRSDKIMAKLDEQQTDDDFEITTVSAKFEGPVLIASDEFDNVKKSVLPTTVAGKGVRKTQVIQPMKAQIASTSTALGTPGRETRSRTGIMSMSLHSETIPKKTPNSKTPKKTKCPICGDLFSSNEIQEHASTCGLTSELEIENNLPPNDLAAMTCHICDKVLLLSSEYEVHVKECIKQSRS